MPENKIDEETGIETTGHTWDGIRELNNPLPRWWLWTFYITIIWGIGYTIAYPAWPLIEQATSGTQGWSSRGEVAQEIARHEGQNAELVDALLAVKMNDLSADLDLNRYAIARGKSVFAAQCSQCHGAGAAGATGYPNLLDNDWLWGGSMDEIVFTVRHGIRNETDDNAHWSAMPNFGDLFSKEEIEATAEYVLSLTTADIDNENAATGAALFTENCASCHGNAAKGDRSIGAPNLADAIWLYGGDRASLIDSITNSRFGVMPAWGQRLKEEDVRAVSAYIHALGGGE